MRERTFARLSALDPQLANKLSAALPLPWYRILNADEEKAPPVPGKPDEEDPNKDPEEEEDPKEEDAPSSTTVLIYEEIGGSFGVNASDFVTDLNNIDTDEINIRINSPGGALFDGITIYNALLAHPSHVRVHVDGIAASAASIIAMGGDEIVMMPGSQLMIHDAIGVITGNAADMKAMQTFLDRQSNNIASIYSYRNGDQSPEAISNWRTAMLAETWYMANEAVEAGLADSIFLKPKSTRGEGGGLEVELEEDEDGNPVPPEEDDTEDSITSDLDIEALMSRPFKVRNSKWGNRKRAPKPYMPEKVSADSSQFNVAAFVAMAEKGL
jgi:ATP-dependent protease ClpP protease subunit